MTVRPNSNGKDKDNSLRTARARLSAYMTPEDKREWDEMVKRASEIDGIRNPDNGTYLSRFVRHGLRLDLASMEKYKQTHPKVKSHRG